MVRARALKKRYIAFTIKSTAQFNEERVKHAIYEEALTFFGEYGLSFVALKLVKYDAKNNVGILRCARGQYNEVLGFLALVNDLDKTKARTIVIASSGTLAALSRKIDSLNKNTVRS